MIQKKGLSDFSKTEKRVCDTLHFHKPFFLQCMQKVKMDGARVYIFIDPAVWLFSNENVYRKLTVTSSLSR